MKWWASSAMCSLGALALIACTPVLQEIRHATILVDESRGGQVIGVRECGRVVGVTAGHLADEGRLTGPRAERVDLALVTHPVPTTGLALSSRPHTLGEPVWIIHSPQGMNRVLSEGVVMQEGVTQESTFPIQMFVWGGSSGGAVVDRQGELLGILIGAQYFVSPLSPFPQIVPIAWAIDAQTIQNFIRAHVPACAETRSAEAEDVPEAG